MKKDPPLIVLSGASGSGKTTLCRMAADEFGLYYTVSHTTRPMRGAEKDGEHYHFISRDEFDRMVRDNDFVEWAEVYGNRYGTSRQEVEARLKKGQGVILDLDPQGALALRKIWPKAVLIFILAPSREVLEQRLSQRGTEGPEALAKRLKEAEAEEAQKRHYDHVLVNENLQNTFQELENILKTRYHLLNA